MKKKKKERERERGSMGTCSKDTSRLVAKRSCYTELSESAEQAKRRTEIARQYKPLSQSSNRYMFFVCN